MKKLIFMMISFVVLASCASGPSTSSGGGGEPAWLEDKSAVYSDDEFLSAIGQGDTLTEAQTNASTALAKIFKVSIEVESSMQSRYEEYSENGLVTSYSDSTVMTDNINQSTDQTLMNVKYGETYKDDLGRVFTIAYLNRAETGSVYKDLIEDNAETVLYLMDRSDEQSDILRQYAFLDAAFVVASSTEVLIEQLKIISPAILNRTSIGYDLQDLQTTRADLASEMSFSVNIRNDSDQRITNIVTDLLTDQGFTVERGGSLILDGEVRTEEVELDNGYDNIRWFLLLDLKDQRGRSAVTLEENNRSSSVSLSAAEARAYKDMEKLITKDFLEELNGYFDSFVEK